MQNNQCPNHMKKYGFTLIELLVVIVIIGLLSSIGIASFTGAISKSRDAQRRSDLKEISQALERYYLDHGTYRLSDYGAGWSATKCGCGWAGYETGPGTYYVQAVTRGLYDDGLVEKPLVDDPTQRPGYMLYICEGGNVYGLSATLENPTPEGISDAKKTCNGTGSNGTVDRYGKNYAVGNARCDVDATSSCPDADGKFKP